MKTNLTQTVLLLSFCYLPQVSLASFSINDPWNLDITGHTQTTSY